MIRVADLLLLLVLVAGFVIVSPELPNVWMEYVPFLVVAMTFMTSMLILLRARPSGAVFGIVIAFWFLYYVRFVAVVLRPEWAYFLVPMEAWSAFEDQDTRRASFTYTSIAFYAYCLAVIIYWAWSQRRWLRSRAEVQEKRVEPSLWVVAGLVVTIVLLNATFLSFGIGKQGTFVEEPLPFKLTGLLVYTKGAIIPCLLNLQIYWAMRTGQRGLARLGVLVLIVSGAFDMVVFESRGAVLQHLAILGIIWIIAGFRFQRTDKIIVTAAASVAIAAIPLVTAIRLTGDVPQDVIGLEALSLEAISAGLGFVFFRLTGMDQFMVILHLGAPIAGGDVWNVVTSLRGIPGHYTEELLGYSELVPQTFAPSGLGWLYLVGGMWAIVIGAMALGIFTAMVWDLLDTLFRKTSVVAKGFFVFFITVMFMEGVGATPLKSLFVVMVTLQIAERVTFPRAREGASGKAA